MTTNQNNETYTHPTDEELEMMRTCGLLGLPSGMRFSVEQAAEVLAEVKRRGYRPATAAEIQAVDSEAINLDVMTESGVHALVVSVRR